MTREELMALTDEALLDKKKKLKKAKIINAFMIGFLFAVVVYSFIKNTWGLLTLIPVFMIYRLLRNAEKDKDLEAVLKERNLE